jgi:hypothetical protein
MIIYEVNLEIDTAIYEQFKTWLYDHVKEMLQLEGFLEAKILHEQSDSTEKKKLKCCYLLISQKNLDNYLTTQALHMRQEGIDKFGHHFSATRKIFEVVESICRGAPTS